MTRISSIIGMIAIIAFVCVIGVSGDALAPGPTDGCCWAKSGQQFRFNQTLTSSDSKYPVLTRAYTQWDTKTGITTFIIIIIPMQNSLSCFL
jgi:hypothetical protein